MPDTHRLLVCDCAGSMTLDPERLARAAGADSVVACSRLCEEESATAAEALASGARVTVACGQMAALFEEMAEDAGAEARLLTVDIRDRAGWTADGAAPAKQAALLAEGQLPARPAPAMDVTSDGVCLVLGRGEAALAAAERLAGDLAVTCVLEEAPDLALPPAGFDLALGRVSGATGAFGGFELRVDRYAPLDPAGRGSPGFRPARDGARTECDLILDLRGATPLFPVPEKREGYLRADPRDPAAVERAVHEASQLVGTFEKPLHIRFDAQICAHSRAGRSGCTRCLEVCPVGAITPGKESVEIDPLICAGCGACAAVCPSGAASYDDPPVEHLFRRLRTLASAWREAGGGGAPRALFHDEFGAEMIALSARHGRGLPADVIPVSVPNVEGVGHAEALAALGVGFAEALILAGPRTDRATPEAQLALTRALLEGAGREAERARLIDPADPDALEETVYGARAGAMGVEPVMPLGGRRETTRLAMQALAGPEAPPIPLPEGAPYGQVIVDTDACTLCLACAGLCPVGALMDNPDKPQLRFQEDACLQCGICASGCPENAITLEPRMDLSPAAFSARLMKEEEPYACIECGKLFGVKSTIERIVEKLESKHWMYSNSDNTRLIRMCDDCRVRAQYHAEASPFRMGEPPRVRTTEDYLRERDEETPER